MKPFLLIIALLLLASSGCTYKLVLPETPIPVVLRDKLAGEDLQHDVIRVEVVPPNIDTNESSNLVITMPNDCEAKMEAAMLAYDKFVNYGLAVGRPEDDAERIKAIQLWDAVKRECFKDAR